MNDWKYLQKDTAEKLAVISYFSVKKRCAGGEMDVRITVWEFAKPEIGAMHFFAQADVILNQDTAPFQPCGWGHTLTDALGECLQNIRKFDYQAGTADL